LPENHGGPDLFLPKHWHRHVRSAVLHTMALARLALAEVRGWAVNSPIARLRLAAQLDHARQEIALLREELRIKDTRMAQIAAHRRPHYPPTERMAILELKAARGWNQVQAAKAMMVTPATVAAWTRRIEEQGPTALVQLPEPVNRFADAVRHIVRRLKALCPSMGKARIAQMLARAGLHLAATTVGRVLKERGRAPDAHTPAAAEADVASPEKADAAKKRVVTAKYPNHVWHVDLTAVPIVGFWVPWLPFALLQVWPFCWWVAVVEDHFSRRVMGFRVFRKQPTGGEMRAFLACTIRTAGVKPKYAISDKGPQFWSDGYTRWCKRRGIRPRFGAVGKHGSIAVVERFIRSLKQEGLRHGFVSSCQRAFCQEVSAYSVWHNEHRPHTALGGATPNEIYSNLRPAIRAPRFEPRTRWPRGSPCAEPQTLVKGKPGVRLELAVTFQSGRKHLPIVTLCRLA
jgi:transposase InsO family protein